MKWTKELPTRPGWYWWKDTSETRILQIVLISTGLAVRDGDFCEPFVKYAGEWQGPLTPDNDGPCGMPHHAADCECDGAGGAR